MLLMMFVFPFDVQGDSDEKDLDKATILMFLDEMPNKQAPYTDILRRLGKSPGYTNRLLQDLQLKKKIILIDRTPENYYQRI